MIASIIVEEERDRLFVDAALHSIVESAHRFEVLPAGGRSSAMSLASSYLTLPDRAVGLVLNAETTYSRQVQEQRSTLRQFVEEASDAQLAARDSDGLKRRR